MPKFLNPDAVKRLMALAGQSYRPKQILELKALIDAETKAMELHYSISEEIDKNQVDKIVEMKLQLDCLYGAWAEGKIE